MKPIQSTAKATGTPVRQAPATAALKAKKESLERRERRPSRVFRIEKRA